ncbi:MAG: T9SS type A sorting domain-containing protein [Flavobacteriales bacterium]|nr:T9SS type A sorting domain-containing protein [Flavobacteriales bacterium]
MKKNISSLLILLITSPVFAQTTYNDIAPALYNNCTSCHRPGGGAPFSMLSYNDISPWTTAIQTVLNNGDMPPWAADTSYLHFSNERFISQADRDTILAWISDGALQGNPSLLPPPPNYPQYQLNGTPDTIISLPAFYSNAGANDAYNTFVIPLTLTQSRFIRAIELVPNNPALIHHAIINADTAGKVATDTSGNSYTILGDISIGTYAPGTRPVIFPGSAQLKMGVAIPANAEFIMQIHTPAGTQGQPLSINVRLYFYNPGETGIRPVYNFVPLQYWENDFWIAPGTIKSFSTEQATFPYPISIYSAFPHSHQICTEILNFAYDTTTFDTTRLMKIDDWDFEHQEYYYYRNLVTIPTGYKFSSTHKYDNTSSNPNNPFSPPQLITGGLYSTDEMLFDGFQFITYLPGDESINIDSILSTDSLLTVGIWENYSAAATMNTSTVYPNPVSDRSTITFSKKQSLSINAELRVWTIEGKAVNIAYQLKKNSIEIQKSNLKPNLYIYQIIDGSTKISSGKFIVR